MILARIIGKNSPGLFPFAVAHGVARRWGSDGNG
jgi:hypothetical protein